MSAFVKNKGNNMGTDKLTGNATPMDERSNKGPAPGAKSLHIGLTKGRYKFSKMSVDSLNTGQSYYRDVSVGIKNAGGKGDMPKGVGKREKNKGAQGY